MWSAILIIVAILLLIAFAFSLARIAGLSDEEARRVLEQKRREDAGDLDYYEPPPP